MIVNPLLNVSNLYEEYCKKKQNQNIKITIVVPLQEVEAWLLINQKEKLPTTEDIIRLAVKNNASQKDVVAITGMNKSSISRKWNNELMQLAT